MAGKTKETLIKLSVDKIDKYLNQIYELEYDRVPSYIIDELSEALERYSETIEQIKIDIRECGTQNQYQNIDDDKKEIIMW